MSKKSRIRTRTTQSDAVWALTEQMDAIEHFEDQIEAAEKVSEAIEDLEEPMLLAPVIDLLERSADEDDFGVFHSFGSFVEQFEADTPVFDATLSDLLCASIGRRPCWKVVELFQAIVEPHVAIPTLKKALKDKTLSDDDRDGLETALEELLEG